MNYLAHAYLAQPNAHSLTGNLLGDFCKGVDLQQLPEAVLAGLANHRAVDRFTDQHPLVLELKQQFSVQRRRFSGVALDVLFDHLLIQHWQPLTGGQFRQDKAQIYQQLQLAEPLMPPNMAATMSRVRQQDWFTSYQDLTQLGLALDRIAQRIRFANQFHGIIDEIRPQYALIEQHFLAFFPQLQQHVAQLALETDRPQ